MSVEQTNDNQIKITLSSSVDSFGLQRIIDYIKYLEVTVKSKATQEDANDLADTINDIWWKNNRKRFIK